MKDDLPTYINESGVLIWVDSNDETHRDIGPAIINPNGVLEYWKHGVQERFVCPDGLRVKVINEKLFEIEDAGCSKHHESHEIISAEDFRIKHNLDFLEPDEKLLVFKNLNTMWDK